MRPSEAARIDGRAGGERKRHSHGFPAANTGLFDILKNDEKVSLSSLLTAGAVRPGAPEVRP